MFNFIIVEGLFGRKISEDALLSIFRASNEAQQEFLVNLLRKRVGSTINYNYSNQAHMNHVQSFRINRDFALYYDKGMFLIRLQSHDFYSFKQMMKEVWDHPSTCLEKITPTDYPKANDNWWGLFMREDNTYIYGPPQIQSNRSGNVTANFAVSAKGLLKALGCSPEEFEEVGRKAAIRECMKNHINCHEFFALEQKRKESEQ